MTLLLDTCTVPWFWWNDPQLSPAALALITDPANRKRVSRASPWEVAIKVSQGKLNVSGPYRGFFPRHMAMNNFEWLATTDDHLAILSALPFHHKDPFDRHIIAQASGEGLPVLTPDVAFDPYPVRRVW